MTLKIWKREEISSFELLNVLYEGLGKRKLQFLKKK